ncbi:hypothetical protein BX661DRAFT_187352, partial [Kickxella alabastrina]|uniref:uncharacterized protein n=1 Tax=Kickxella alabastrina TaxID=61397 RepID=UPI0022201627
MSYISLRIGQNSVYLFIYKKFINVNKVFFCEGPKNYCRIKAYLIQSWLLNLFWNICLQPNPRIIN